MQVGCSAACTFDAGCKLTAKTATQIVCPSGVISPSLVNPHDHLTYAQNNPYKNTGERYEQRNDWRERAERPTMLVVPGGSHHGPGSLRASSAVSSAERRPRVGAGRRQRRLLRHGRQPGPCGARAVHNCRWSSTATFPLGDVSRHPACDRLRVPERRHVERASPRTTPILPHVAEGIDALAARKRIRVSHVEERPGPRRPRRARARSCRPSASRAFDYADMAQHGTSSDLVAALEHHPVRQHRNRDGSVARMGINIALGTDLTATGSMDLLRELACADSFGIANVPRRLLQRSRSLDDGDRERRRGDVATWRAPRDARPGQTRRS